MVNNVKLEVAIAPTSVSDNTLQTSLVVDRSGYESVSYLIQTGTFASTAPATFTVSIEESETTASTAFAAVADEDLVLTEAAASFTSTDASATRKLGYIGGKRCTRLKIQPAGNTGAAFFSAQAMLGHARTKPVT